MLVFWNLKASDQIKEHKTQSSSIILALTDGKLEVYVHELTVNQVRVILLNKNCLVLSVRLMMLIWRLTIPQPLSFCSTCCTSSAHLFDPQAVEARKYGARVYCVGVKDFDEQQVRKLTNTFYHMRCCVGKANRSNEMEKPCDQSHITSTPPQCLTEKLSIFLKG